MIQQISTTIIGWEELESLELETLEHGYGKMERLLYMSKYSINTAIHFLFIFV